MRLKRSPWRRNPATPLNCAEVVRNLQIYLDGGLHPDDLPLIEAHLDQCASCGLEAATYMRIKAALAQPSPAAVDPEALARLRTFAASLSHPH